MIINPFARSLTALCAKSRCPKGDGRIYAITHRYGTWTCILVVGGFFHTQKPEPEMHRPRGTSGSHQMVTELLRTSQPIQASQVEWHFRKRRKQIRQMTQRRRKN
ncbi:uncharacterized protein PV06_03174 [Exophiala oligosperma]|uniref:Uncharacterized protein n=1 Tax=Exophiala oligosperma TaxID=215243 RepID=A0A0D2C4K0_9EURO|nr:uncharacterized protein PV06_03174 [Exophiala oligosperma]KIW44722.1 hypothetical protein PV06_03174 [Exophiala oligosperma]